MPKEKEIVAPIAKCGCGRSLHIPYCDGSHGRSEEQYEEWKRQTELEKQKAVSSKK